MLFVMCTKNEEIIKTGQFITLKDETGKAVTGATVRVYKNVSDTGITQLSDTTGVVYFPDLEVALYYWLAEKGCKTNRNSQVTLFFLHPIKPTALFLQIYFFATARLTANSTICASNVNRF